MAVIQFCGKLDSGWTKAIQPKGSRLIAHIPCMDQFDPSRLMYAAVFQSLKKSRKLTLFETREGREPEWQDRDKPISSFKFLVDHAKGEIAYFISKEEILALLSEESLAQEETEKKREIARIPNKLRAINDELNNMEGWAKYEKVTDNKAKRELLYYFSSIANSCTTMATNILVNIFNESESEEEAIEIKASGM